MNFRYFSLVVYLLTMSVRCFADPVGIGGLATELMEPVGVVSDFVHTACLIVGIAFLFACLVKYMEHKRSPLMVPISTVIFLFIAGIFLIVLPFLGDLTENGFHYRLYPKS